MLIVDLKAAAAKFLQKKTSPQDVFIVLDLWVLLEELDKTAGWLRVKYKCYFIFKYEFNL
jgi:hypothetical protein